MADRSDMQPEPRDVMAGTRAMMAKVAIGVVVGMVVAAVVFWLGWVRAPAPEEVCAHKIELVVDTVGEDQTEGAQALIGQLEAKCVAAIERKIRLRGKIVYAQYAKCVVAATSLMEAERC